MSVAKLKIDLSQGMIEVEGSEALILELYSDFKDRFKHMPISSIQPKLSPTEVGMDVPQAEPIAALPAPTAPAKVTTATKSSTSAPRKVKRPSKEEPKLLSDLDLNQGPLGRLKEFHAKYAPKTNMEQNLIFTYFLRDGLGLEEISEDHLYTCYRAVSVKVPKALRQSVLDTANTKGWLGTDSTGTIKLTTAGRNHIEHDMEKAQNLNE